MASVVEICNRALQKVGAARITTITEDSVAARACNALYEPLRDAELRNHNWGFSIKRRALAADSTAPAFTKDNQYTLPAECLYVLPPDDEDNRNDLDWIIEDGKIVTNDSAPLNIRYVAQVTDPNKMDPLFREALATKMAFELCEELTQSNTKKESLREDYKEIIVRARRRNAIENKAQEPPEDTFLTCRR